MNAIYILPFAAIACWISRFGEAEPDISRTVDQDWTACVEQYDVKWGDEDCSQCHSYQDTYKVFLRNKCDAPIDVQCCVQEDNKTWRCFSWYEINPGDTVAPYACKGTGKYMYWSRKAGDKGSPFPTREEVNRDHPD
ncbi:MAG: hypothetical protein KDD36_05895 [Flavobacteriales bacterium]|nr:hypothetical protein [Flavobacteriales bacterium]